LPRKEWILKTIVIESEQNSTVFTHIRVYALDARNTFSNPPEYGTEALLMLTLHELDDIADVIASGVEVALRTRGRQPASRVGCEIT
jgi:hypothetical protein